MIKLIKHIIKRLIEVEYLKDSYYRTFERIIMR